MTRTSARKETSSEVDGLWTPDDKIGRFEVNSPWEDKLAELVERLLALAC